MDFKWFGCILEPVSLSEVIETDRLLLKKHEESNAENMFKTIDLERLRLRIFLPWVDFTKTSNDTLSFITESIESWKNLNGFGFSIFLKTSGKFIGNVGLHNIKFEHDRCEVGYWISDEHEGQGLMSEAVSGLEEEAFKVGFNRVEIRCSSTNERSANLPRRLGYALEAVLKQDLIEQGKYRDTLIFAKLKGAPIVNDRAGSLHHVEMYVSDLDKTKKFWVWFLGELKYKVVSDWDQGISLKYKDTYLVFVQTENEFLVNKYHRCNTGLNHLAFHAESRKQVDEITLKLKERKINILYENKHPYAGGKDYYAVFFEDPDRIKVELVAS